MPPVSSRRQAEYSYGGGLHGGRVMSLKDRISDQIKAAMKSKDKIRLETVRSIKKIILEKESSIRGEGRESLTEAEEMEVLMQQAKQRRDSIDQYVTAGREDLADKERQELTIIEEYLPKQLTEEEVGAIVDEIIANVGATSPKDMGKVMGPAMQRLKGQADGKLVQQVVKAKLS
ncbi:MAG: GatB/YqeY domain-containing protein [Geitlerinemataceae cyanobacterium]